MHPVAPTPDQVCGRCSKFEPARSDPKYGYCKPHMRLEAERTLLPKARVFDVDHPCVLVVWHGMEQRRPAFVAKEPE